MNLVFRALPDNYGEHLRFDLDHDRRLRSTSLLMRAVAVLVFVPLFAGVAIVANVAVYENPTLLWSLAGASGAIAPAVRYVALVVVLFSTYVVHHVIHAAVYRVAGVPSMRFDLNGLALTASTDGWYATRTLILIGRVAPFLIVSTVGTILLFTIPDDRLAWAYVPVVFNAVVSAGDVMVISWLLFLPRGALVVDHGATYQAYAPR